jgi:pSer/pThr/pTyr-binding forkhead associated (FHA) protein
VNSLYKLYWVKDDGQAEVFDLSNILEKYENVFIGRLSSEDAYEAKKQGVSLENPYSLFIFKPNEYYYYTKVIDSYVSRKHALLELREEGLFIIDYGREGKGSQNGTFINGKRIKPREAYPLNHGDEISLGMITKITLIHKDMPLTISTPKELGKNDIETIKDKGINVDAIKTKTTNKYIAYIKQDLDKPIQLNSGIKIIAGPDLNSTILKLLKDISEANVKFVNKESDRKSCVDLVLASLDLVKMEIENILKEKGATRVLDNFTKAIYVLDNYVKGYENEEIVKENLVTLKNVLNAIREYRS